MWTRTVVALLLVATGCATGGAGDGGRPQVIASFYPLEYVVQRVGGDAVDATSLTPGGVEPHDLELSSAQIRDLVEADLVVYLGSGFQPAVEDALEEVDGPRRFDALDGLDLLPATESEDDRNDPHVWLDPSLLSTIADEVTTRLAHGDPAHASVFEDNADALRDELADLDRAFEDGLKRCESRDIVTSHAAFGYLAARYGLDQVSVTGIDPEAEPSAQRLADVARFVSENDVHVIFFEELAPPDLAETLARETGARTEVLSPLETQPEDGDYVTEMRLNLERLREALSCE
jgi:zinc transport system substrate-binding protein